MTFRKHWLSARAQPDRAGMSRAEHTERCLEVFTGAVCHVVLDLPFAHGVDVRRPRPAADCSQA